VSEKPTNDNALLKSSMVIETEDSSISDILNWIRKRRESVEVVVEKIPLDQINNWNFQEKTGNIIHESGKFFSIVGVSVVTKWTTSDAWNQPIISQPEVGILGILTKKINGILMFLMQAKIEPGNLNFVQISPTLQATKSNYTQVHKGNKPVFLEYFNGEKNVKFLLDQLQSEQGSRFFKKRNRNIIVEIGEQENVEVPDDFMWMSLGQIKNLMQYDNMINMDTRTVISSITFDFSNKKTLSDVTEIDSNFLINNLVSNSIFEKESQINSFHDITSWMTRLKSTYELHVKKIPLNIVNDWIYDEGVFRHQQNKYFSVIGVRSSIKNREVVSWDQPMIQPAQEGLIGFIAKPVSGTLYFLVQAKLEVGNFDIIELAPTVQCLTGNYRKGLNEYSIPFIDRILKASPESILYSAMQSEEGGRFYYEQNKNIIIVEGENYSPNIPDNYCWMSYGQILHFMQFNNNFNIAARSLISAISILDFNNVQ
jgi:dTDP-4-dehydro-6-deoxy-alpha-D-glucopyranose 2,3-dehydratase